MNAEESYFSPWSIKINQNSGRNKFRLRFTNGHAVMFWRTWYWYLRVLKKGTQRVSSHIKRMKIYFSYASVFMMFSHINAANRYAAADKEIMIAFSTISNSKEFQEETRLYLIGLVVCLIWSWVNLIWCNTAAEETF